MPIGTRHTIDPNFKQGGSLGVIEQLDLTTSYPQTVAIVDASGNQITSFGELTITGIGHGTKVVTTAGTDVVLAASTTCKRVVIQSQTDNTTGISVGAAGVDATVATGTGIFLYPGDSIELDIDNLADVFIDALTNGEGVRYTYFT